MKCGTAERSTSSRPSRHGDSLRETPRTPRSFILSSIDVLVPGAVVLGSLLFIALLWWLRREQAPEWDIAPDPAATEAPAPVDAQLLATWHLEHGPAVGQWIAAHERVLTRISDAGLALDLTDAGLTEEDDALVSQLQAAITAHPAPVMRAELSAMQVAADSTIHAVRKSDYITAERQHVTYLDYRGLWVGRLRQFSPNDASLSQLRARPRRTLGSLPSN